MEVKLGGGKSFSHLIVKLGQRESIKTEAGAMASMDSGIDLKSKMNGGFFRALALALLGRESFFINRFTNTVNEDQTIYLTQKTPGEVVEQELKGEDLYIQPGSFIACTSGVTFSLNWAGFSSFLAREGLFRLKISGSGKLWYGAYGAVEEKEIDGDYVVDSGHLLSYPPNVKLNIKMSGGIFSSFFGGEGLVLKLSGRGKIKLQTRSVSALASWLNPKFRG